MAGDAEALMELVRPGFPCAPLCPLWFKVLRDLALAARSGNTIGGWALWRETQSVSKFNA